MNINIIMVVVFAPVLTLAMDHPVTRTLSGDLEVLFPEEKSEKADFTELLTQYGRLIDSLQAVVNELQEDGIEEVRQFRALEKERRQLVVRLEALVCTGKIDEILARERLGLMTSWDQLSCKFHSNFRHVAMPRVNRAFPSRVVPLIAMNPASRTVGFSIEQSACDS